MNKCIKFTFYTFILFMINILFCNGLEYSHTFTRENTNITNYIGLKNGYITYEK